ncbi:sulfite exporter TauE/SafE family protein [Isoptericola sp. G70]|uniref:sulfite exporter TauE/SafE family protein n=1 Tax=Isoptericola sp. G70 TaxID=3376633 RepID=UPI003A80F6C9
MDISTVLVLLLAVVVGLSLGLLGGGGSILTVPLLTYVARFPPKEAIAASLLVVGVTSVASMLAHARRGNVRWRTGLIFGAAGMAGAFVGGLVGGQVPGTILMIAFAVMMIATAAAMLRGRRTRPAPSRDAGGRPWLRIVVDGLVVGLVTGLVGAGGGFLVVPALALLAGLPMAVAAGTSLLVIAMKSFAGLAGYLTTVSLDLGLVAGVTAAAVVGSLIGARLTSRVPEAALRRGFGYFVLAMGVVVLGQELPGAAALVVVTVAVLAAAAAIMCRLVRNRCPWSAQPGLG